ncbi:MAG: D-cysteine desulfhydrase family protein [bacterium]|nr:D-cysteine desulfhydrase family protein [bacterium]
MARSLSCAELRVRIARLPRVSLGHFPTPLDFCPRLTDALGGPRIFVKRDDCTGLAFGGNKVRQLEFTVAQAVRHGADVLVGGAGSQSNHCRQLAAAAARNGLDCALVVVKDHKSGQKRGNLLLDDLLGASVERVAVASQEELGAAKEALVERLTREGRKPFVVMREELQHLGAMGYALCMAELADQFNRMGERLDTVVVSSGSTTQPGLIFGNRVLGLDARIIGMAPIVWSHDLKTAFLDVLSQMGKALDLDVAFSSEDIINLASYVGPQGYGHPSPEGNEAFRLMARSEGLFLDPIYSAKALAGLIDLVQKGQIGPDETVVFLHTGGTPLVFAYAEELLASNSL